MAKVFLRKKITSRIAEGHPWIFFNEIGDIVGDFTAGSILSVFSSSGSFVGKGYINPQSKIRIRLLTRKEEEINVTFFEEKFQQAWGLRKKMGLRNYCRLVYAESDGLPGLIIDKFEDVFVYQTLTLGMEILKPLFLEALVNVFDSKKIIGRNDASVRLLEGLPLHQEFPFNSFATNISIQEQETIFQLNVKTNPKTGFFWDQEAISNAITPYYKNAQILDIFCASGWHAVQSCKHQANSYTGIDFNPELIEMAKKNVAENKCIEGFNFLTGNAFDLLKSEQIKKGLFTLILLDPPPLTKTKSQINQALSAYRELNIRAMKLLSPDGILVTTCSSYFITPEMMINLIQTCALDCKKNIRLIGTISQRSDHPVLLNLPSSDYFQGYILSVQ